LIINRECFWDPKNSFFCSSFS